MRVRNIPGFMHLPYWFYQLRRSLYLSPEQLRDLQRRRLSAIVRHAYEHVPYYRQLFDRAGVNPGDIRSVEDLQALPVTTKADLREYPRQALVAPHTDGRNYQFVVTSGSTGMPLHVHISRQENWLRNLVFLRTFMETGYRLNERMAWVETLREKDLSRWWFQNWGLYRKYPVCIFDDLDVQIASLRQLQPQNIHGYPSALEILARALIERGITDIRPRVISTGAELLGEGAREIISQGFGAPVFDTYSAVEFGNIAWECPAGGGYHINSDLVLVEFLADGRPAQPGERAEIVCTSLYSYTMPFIRYNLGDIGVQLTGTCSCGRGLPLMKVIEGRADDFVRLANGQAVSPIMLVNTLRGINGIKQHRVIQEEAGVLQVCIVGGERSSLEIAGEVEARLREALSDNVEVKVQFVDEIPRDSSGKVRSIMSKIR